jgi:benzoyl-CoA reductase/2-hydroxyglutaryl-CoA dehydratase subunit BcrC/BadD/HgdB
MSQLMERLAQLDLRWKESKKTEKLRPFSIFDEPSVNVNIEVVNSAGTAKVKLNGSLACEKLAALDSVFQTRRALLEFQEFRFQMNCSISGFNHFEYMQMVLREHTQKLHGSSPN